MGCAASSVAAGVGYELSEKEAAELAVLEPHEEVRVVLLVDSKVGAGCVCKCGGCVVGSGGGRWAVPRPSGLFRPLA